MFQDGVNFYYRSNSHDFSFYLAIKSPHERSLCGSRPLYYILLFSLTDSPGLLFTVSSYQYENIIRLSYVPEKALFKCVDSLP